MQESSSSQPKSVSQCGETTNNNQEENLESLQEQCNRSGRRNALTPESHNIEPVNLVGLIEQTSHLTMASTSSETTVGPHSSNNQAG